MTSLALHAGGLALMDAYYGAPLSGGARIARHQAPLRVVFLDARMASLGNESAGLGPDAAGGASVSLPEGIVSLPGPYYFPPQELSRKPQAAAPVPLDYPENAPLVAKNHVVLRLLISEAGDVDKIIVETADVPGELEALARLAFAQAKFQPGLRGETPVKSQMFVEITFEGGNVPPPSGAMLPAR
ncbi:MAG: energy transducer TonB [Rhodocyclales bacterium]|nr:energy transducer TonB [Rhodocyclales bacterium]